jgi:hypothetical protein
MRAAWLNAFRGSGGDVSLVLIFLTSMSALGFLCLILAAGVKHNLSEALTVVVSGLFLAGAATLSGGIVGFLFGVPRQRHGSRRKDVGSGESSGELYRPNTNLEQVSDWLTKMIIGIGLTQIPNIIDFFKQVGSYCGPAFGERPAGEIIATSVVIHYLWVGFLLGFLTAYLWLPGAFSRANSGSATGAPPSSTRGDGSGAESTNVVA